MKSYKAKMLYDSQDGELQARTVYLDADKISSFYIEDAEDFRGEQVKCYGITCDGAYYSILPEQHIYSMLFDKFIDNAKKLNIL